MLNVIMLSVVMLSVVMQSVTIKSIMLNVVKLSAIMLSVAIKSIILNVNLLSVTIKSIMLDAVLLSVLFKSNMLNVVRLTVIMLNDVALISFHLILDEDIVKNGLKIYIMLTKRVKKIGRGTGRGGFCIPFVIFVYFTVLNRVIRMLEKNHPTFLKSSQNSRRTKKSQNINTKGQVETAKQVKVLFNARQKIVVEQLVIFS